MTIKKIVVADDEMMIRKALETQLHNKRHSVASTGHLSVLARIWREILATCFFWIYAYPMVKGLIYWKKL
jgi:DNA-binding NtrC family response regulator